MWNADLDLTRRALSGDREARHEFARRMEFVPHCLRLANRRLGTPLPQEDLADLVQDTLVLIWRKLARYEGRASLETWAYHFGHFELMNRLRARMRDRRLGPPLPDEIAHDPVSREYGVLEHALDDLGPPEADVVRLKHYEGLTFADIAQRLSIPQNTAKSRYYRGIRWLRRHLSKVAPEGSG